MLYLFDDIERFGSAELASARCRVSAQRWAYAQRYHFEHDRKLSVIAYLLLLHGLRREYGIEECVELGSTEAGKPYIIGHLEISFSMSHCRRAVGCAIFCKSVGLDIEEVRPLNSDLVSYCCSEAEQSLIADAQNPAEAFAKLWTKKESYLKMLGTGLSGDLRHVLDSANQTAQIFTATAADKSYVYSLCGMACEAVSVDLDQL